MLCCGGNRLERIFGIAQSPSTRAGSAAVLGASANLFPAEFGESAGRAKSSGDTLFGREEFLPGADTAQRNSMGATNAGTSAAVKASSGAAGHRHGKGNKGAGRKGFEPLHIQTMTQDRLQAALAASKVGVKLSVLFCQT